jgi:hypothetical protein
MMKHAGMLAVRAVGGALLAGHGAQKLFGAFGVIFCVRLGPSA